ncbi:hypothetical protein, partial [Stygiolobus sp. RP850M]|uniref:hypothetical protein n=1 Tax=Stygiolobus sp. RP850M TaxID=3133137 RepID=UPI00307EB546
SKDHRRIGEINIRYTANNDDESIRIAKSVCEKLGGEEIEELILGKVMGTITGAGRSLSKSDDDKFLGDITGVIVGALVGHIIDSAITKVIYSKKYPCIKPRPFEDIVNYINIERLEEIVNER